MYTQFNNLTISDKNLLLQEAFNKTLEGILFLEEGTVIECNEAAVTLFGLNSKAELIGKTPFELSPEFQEERIKSIGKAMEMLELCKNQGRGSFRWQYLSEKGDKVYFDVTATLVTLRNKSLIHCTLRDISEIAKVYNDLREREEMFRVAFENAPSGMSILSNEGFKYLAVNPLLCEMFGYTKEQFMNQTIKLVTHPDDEERSNEWIRKKYNCEPCEPIFEKRYIHKDGHIVYGLVSSEWIKNIDGSRKMAVTHILDVTKIKLAELELIKHRDHLENLVKERTEELLSSNEELLAVNEELIEQRKRLEEALEILKNTQEQLIHSEKMASLGILTAGVAHEINNPMNFIFNGTSAIEISLNVKHPETKQALQPFFDAVNIGIKRVTDIVKSLSIYSRSEDFPYTDCNIHTILDNCLTMLFNEFKNRIEIIKDYYPEAPVLNSNEGQLYQAFMNILTNSIQAITNKGEIKISTGISGKTVSVLISDNGIGISPENLKQIFDPFFTTKDPGKGSGLGLSITQKIIANNNGTISCESALDKGTKFFINLPLK